MEYDKVAVDAEALKQVLEAFSSRVGLMELQVTASLPDSPIQAILADYNTAVNEVNGDSIRPCVCKNEVEVQNNGSMFWIECNNPNCIAGNPTTKLVNDKQTVVQLWNLRKLLPPQKSEKDVGVDTNGMKRFQSRLAEILGDRKDLNFDDYVDLGKVICIKDKEGRVIKTINWDHNPKVGTISEDNEQ